MRKASREMDAAFALEVLDKAPYVTVSMIKSDGSPYGLPLSLVRTDEKTFYFHCALEGDKLDCIRHCPTVFLSAVTKCAPTEMRQIMTKFQERNGATQCKLLKGIGTKVVLRECPDCVADAAEFLEEQLNG